MKYIDNGWFFAGIFVLIVGGAFGVAIKADQDKSECIESGRVYIEHHCYDNLPVEVKR